MHDITLTLKLKTAEGVLCLFDQVKHGNFCTTRLSTTVLLNKTKDLHGYRCSIQYSEHKNFAESGGFWRCLLNKLGYILNFVSPQISTKLQTFTKPFCSLYQVTG